MVYLNQLGVISALGHDKISVLNNILSGYVSGMRKYVAPVTNKEFFVGAVDGKLANIPHKHCHYRSRNNQLALTALQQMLPQIDRLKKKYANERIGIIVGSSTSGVAETEAALKYRKKYSRFPQDYFFKQHEMSSVTEFLSSYLEISGPSYVISTACSSSGKALVSARNLLEMDICDAVIVGGVDSLCELTLNGFTSLEAVSNELNNPFSINRKGINIGEAAAFFIMSKQESKIALLGVGESSDAHHMSAPDPNGRGAIRAMLASLEDAKLKPEDVDYINLHGTATILNDEMESRAINNIFGDATPASSTKPMTGHTLGAAGAIEAAICWLLLNDKSNNIVAPHLYDGYYDPELPKIQLCQSNHIEQNIQVTMSNSFAFGGSNVSLLLGKIN